MAVQETTMLPHRLARSAKELAQASLSGVACELKDPRMAKQAGSSSQATASAHQHGGSQSGEVPTSRPALFSRENSFRNQSNASASRAVEEDFVRFQEKDLSQNAWLSSDLTACVKLTSASESYEGSSYGIQHKPQPSHYLTSEAEAKDRANDAIDSKISRPDTGVMNDSKLDSKEDYARAAAARRLEQIGAQIQRNMAMQMLHQDARSVHDYLLATISMDLYHESAQQFNSKQSTTPQSSHTKSTTDSLKTPQHHHQAPTPDRALASPSNNAEEEEDPQIHFHCPYYACHQNLQRLLTNSSHTDQRLCVHAGCSEESDTRKAWNEHIAKPHHDLQG
jgi:hypothetical protein